MLCKQQCHSSSQWDNRGYLNEADCPKIWPINETVVQIENQLGFFCCVYSYTALISVLAPLLLCILMLWCVNHRELCRGSQNTRA